MADNKNALAVKATKAAKKPEFIQRNHKKKKLARVRKVWKRPRGLDNKLRRKRRGIGCWVQTGYKMPKVVRGTLRSGLTPVVVATVEEVKALNPQEHAVIIKASAGKRRKVELLNAAIAAKISITNIKDPAAYIKAVEEQLKARKEAKKSTVKKKEEAKKAAEKKASKKEDKKEDKEQKSIEDLANEEKEKKKELDKVLTKKE